jgi:hypothetical protein
MEPADGLRGQAHDLGLRAFQCEWHFARACAPYFHLAIRAAGNAFSIATGAPLVGSIGRCMNRRPIFLFASGRVQQDGPAAVFAMFRRSPEKTS